MFDKYLQLLAIGHFVKMPNHGITREKPMDFLLIWVLGGRGFGETEGVRLEATSGHLLTFMPGRSHSYGADPQEPWDILWLHFRGRLAREFLAHIRSYGGMRVDFGFDVDVYDRWVELVATQTVGKPGREIYGNTGLCGLLGLILSRLERKALALSKAESSSLDVQRLQNYIHHHLAEPLTLAALARQAHLSPSHFTRLFKKCFAVSPICYVAQKRIALACSLLSETSMTLSEIGRRIGYDDPYYFSRLFKKLTGVCPSVYRSRQKH